MVRAFQVRVEQYDAGGSRRSGSGGVVGERGESVLGAHACARDTAALSPPIVLGGVQQQRNCLPASSTHPPQPNPPPISDCQQFWEVRSNSVDIAVTPTSNKAFIWWHVRGVQKDTQQVRGGGGSGGMGAAWHVRGVLKNTQQVMGGVGHAVQC